MEQADQQPGRGPVPLLAAAGAGLCWAATLALLLFGGLGRPLEPQGLLFCALALLAILLTFAPLELRMGLPGLTAEGLVGLGLLLYCLAFVPAPRGWLLALPDLPVYAMLLAGLLIGVAALARPFVYALGQRLFAAKPLANDQRRVRRQSYEAGLLVAAAAALSALQVLTWVSLLLLTTALTIAELLFLSLVQAE